MKRLLSVTATLSLILITTSARAQPATTPAAAAVEPTWLDPRLKALPFKQIGPFIELADGGVLCVKDDAVLVTRDDGKTWESRPIFGDRKLKARPEQALIRTKDGTIVFIFLDDLDKRWKWDNKANAHDGEVHLYTWAIRSTDDGKTWSKPAIIARGKRIAYPYVFERRPGVLWVTTMQGNLCAELNEADFVKSK